ncbi:hypothetical protein FB45DRAFT_436478 [Roridomyces roridus]|uniref:Uncharacterized protein n=1 Tax=Roridomyces roridus TaxID=1738132 RepID=A0AAD7B111_9AGAR|nr:hypothetical protein FB45DRAFT_436478 [Roridomyces roridus]
MQPDAPATASSASDTESRTYDAMVGGILVPRDEGVRWWEDKTQWPLPKDHSGDGSVRSNLESILTNDMGVALSVEYVPSLDGQWDDFLVATQFQRGEWEHDGPDIVDLPRQEDEMVATFKEETMRKILYDLGLRLNPGKFMSHYVYCPTPPQSPYDPYTRSLNYPPPGTSSSTLYARSYLAMVAGILVPCEEGVRWYNALGAFMLPENHTADASVRVQLDIILEDEMGVALGVEYESREGVEWNDFLVVTQYQKGEWVHYGPDPQTFDEPRPEDRMKETVKEEEMREILRKLGEFLSCFQDISAWHGFQRARAQSGGIPVSI